MIGQPGKLAILAGFAMGLLAFSQAIAQDAVTLDDIAVPPSGESSFSDYVYRQKVQAVIAPDNQAGRIIGGRESENGAWPSQVALIDMEKYGDDEESRVLSQFCGGSILTREWILTAAHCVVDEAGKPVDPKTLGIVSGSVFIFKGDLRTVSEIVVHEDYDPSLINNDIAMVKLAKPIAESVGPVGGVRVIQQGQEVPEGPAVVMGWGLISRDTVPYQLLETDIDIVPNSVCNRGMAEQTKRELGSLLVGIGVPNNIPMERLQEAFDILSNNLGPRLTENMICAGIPSGERTSCNGDSGGPLMVRETDGQWMQVGIVSWGKEPLDAREPCAHPELFAVYTKVSNYYDWIARHVTGG